jgi:hypothetical protein
MIPQPLVIAGLDPAIHAAAPGSLMDVVAFGRSAWTTGSSPVVTKREMFLFAS